MAITIETPYGSSFDARDLLDHIQGNDRTYIIQGQKVCSFINHKKPNSLDYWLRENFANNKNTKQAENVVIERLVKTGLFREGKFTCPDSGKICKGIEIVP